MYFATLLLLAVCIGMPLYCAWRVWRLRTGSRSAWLIAVTEAALIVALVFIVGRWDMAGYYTRFLLLTLFAAAVFASLWKHRACFWPTSGTKCAPLRHRSRVLSLGVLASM